MPNYDYAAMIRYCDDLTKNGDKLSVTWDGGNDSGWFEMKLNDQPIQETSAITESIVQFLDDYLGYGSFAGDFTTNGEIVYSNETKCFEGHDDYSESDNANKECSIEIRISKEIWFDRLELQVESDYESIQNTSARLVVMNGPRSQKHHASESQIELKVREDFLSEIEDVEQEISGIWEQFSIAYGDFREESNEMVYTIPEFTYNFYTNDYKEVSISLTDQMN